MPILSAGRPFARPSCAKLPIGCLPFALARSVLRLGFGFRLSFSRDFVRLAAFFSASFLAFRFALAFNRNRSARASARFFLRFVSQEMHLQPIGFRYAL